MPAAFIVCQECGAKLKVPASAVARTIHCPRCQSPVPVSVEQEEEAPTRPAARSSQKRTRPALLPEVEDEDAESVPSSARSRQEDDGQDEPRHRRKPQTRGRARKRRGGGVLLWGGIAGGAAVLVAGVVALVLVLMPSKRPVPSHLLGKSHEALVKEVNASMRNTAASLNKVTDAASAEQAVKVVQQETQNLQSLRQALAELGKPSSAERDRVKQHDPEGIAAANGVKEASARVAGMIQSGHLPSDVGQQLASACKDYGQAMVEFGRLAMRYFD